MSRSRRTSRTVVPAPLARRLTSGALALLAALALVAVPARAQLGYFGTNKIQYRNFDWRVLKGAHVDVYYYPAEEQIARMALSYAEESYDYLERRFHHAVGFRIPLIVYASHTDFEQTNVLPFVPPEGVLGVTEYLKQRVTIPFRGSYSEFRHTLRHELVHVFQLSLAQRQFTLYPRGRRAGTPLWWSEGLAEYWSSVQESRDEMVVRDLTLNGRMPTISQLNMIYSPVVYPLGGELHRFLGRKYGDWRVNQLYESLWKYDSFEAAMAATYGRPVEQLTNEWHYDLRQRYFPLVAGRRPVEVSGRELADLAVKPVAVAQGPGRVDVAYLSPRSGYTDIYLKPLHGRGRARVEVKGERTPEFESFHTFSSRIDAREGVLLFASKYGDRDALFFWDTRKNRVVGRYQFPALVSILSPAFSPDGRRVAFSGLSNGGVSDLYVVDLPGGKLTKVTDDRYEDLDPTWLPGGESLVFSSDRTPGGDEGAKNLYRVAVTGGEPTPLTHGMWLDETPRWDAELGRVVFSSDRDGTFNLYSIDTLGNGRRETRIDGGIFDPAPVPGDSQTVVMAFHDLSWSIFTLPVDTLARRDTFTHRPADSAQVAAWQWTELADARSRDASPVRYRRNFSLDFASGGSANAPGLGSAQAGQIYFSDLLGDQAVALSFATFNGGGVGDFFDNFNADVFYLNQQRRLNWGLGLFRLAGNFYEGDLIQVYRERSGGAYGILRYPFSRFTRLEAQTRLEYSNRDDFYSFLVQGEARRRGILSSNFLTFVTDNSLWLETGPIDGGRVNVSGGVVSDMTHGRFENWVGLVDARRYLRTSLQSALAFRLYGYVSEGTRPRAVQVGGSWLLRGYPMYSFDNPVSGTHAWVTNGEWRFPITNFVTVGFPFGSIRFPQVQGAVFNDFGQAWYDRDYSPRVLGSAGVGFRTAIIPGLVLRLDLGNRYSPNPDARALAGSSPGFYRGRFVDFFFGYNY